MATKVLKVHDDGDDFSRYELVLQITCTHKNTHIGDTQRGGNQILGSVQIRKVQDDDDDFSSYNLSRDLQELKLTKRNSQRIRKGY